MAFELMPLPYDPETLEPAVSARTLSFHHGKHHKAYIDKTNAAIEGTGNAGKSLEEIIAAARGSNQGLFNNSAQSWNHGFYWNSLSPSGGAPSGDLASKIDAAFGSLDELKAKLAERGAGHFASGWVWLADKGGQLSIEETHDGDTLADSGFNPLLTVGRRLAWMLPAAAVVVVGGLAEANPVRDPVPWPHFRPPYTGPAVGPPVASASASSAATGSAASAAP